MRRAEEARARANEEADQALERVRAQPRRRPTPRPTPRLRQRATGHSDPVQDFPANVARIARESEDLFRQARDYNLRAYFGPTTLPQRRRRQRRQRPQPQPDPAQLCLFDMEEECPVCMEAHEGDFYEFPCHHRAHHECIVRWSTAASGTTSLRCPLCRKQFRF